MLILKIQGFTFNADDTVIYCSAPTKQQALADLQSAFNIIKHKLPFKSLLVILKHSWVL